MASLVKKKFTTNSRLLNEVLTKYRNTFVAFSELIINSIQAKATEIIIDIEYAKNDLLKSPITTMTIKNNGHGVTLSEFEDKIICI